MYNKDGKRFAQTNILRREKLLQLPHFSTLKYEMPTRDFSDCVWQMKKECRILSFNSPK
jgi:hypothetical protein